jgi:hypothetical protein
MTIRDDDQIRAWAVDYALRLHPKEETVTPEQIISEAKKLARYITATPSAKKLKLVKPDSNRQ